jgi:hypothetical protein
MMQAASDIYLGWTKGVEENRLALLASAARQERLGGCRVDEPFGLTFYAGQCGWMLARAHARSGDPIAIAAYLGEERRVRRFDHWLLRAIRGSEGAGPGAFADAVKSGRLEAIEGG